MYITILNYDTGEIFIHHVCEEIAEVVIENLDEYITNLGFKLSEIEYMVSDELNIKFI